MFKNLYWPVQTRAGHQGLVSTCYFRVQISCNLIEHWVEASFYQRSQIVINLNKFEGVIEVCSYSLTVVWRVLSPEIVFFS